MSKQIAPTATPAGYSIGESSCISRKVVLVNPNDRSWTRDRYVLWFGSYGTTYLMVWGNGLEAALEEATDWIVEHAPGLLRDDAAQEAYGAAIAEGKTPEEAQEEAEIDMTVMGHSGIHYLDSWEWGIALENPTRDGLLEFMGVK